MIGRCVQLAAQPTLPADSVRNAWLTVGEKYLILGIFGRDSSIKFRVIADDGHTPALQDAEQFELISCEIPKDWIFRMYKKGEWELTPSAWNLDGFWVSYFDGEPAAKKAFQDQLQSMRAEALALD